MKKRFSIILLTVLILTISFCSSPKPLTYTRANHTFTSYTNSNYSEVPALYITFYNSRLEVKENLIEIGVLELKENLTQKIIKELAGKYGATGIFKKSNNNYLLLRDKNYTEREAI